MNHQNSNKKILTIRKAHLIHLLSNCIEQVRQIISLSNRLKNKFETINFNVYIMITLTDKLNINTYTSPHTRGFSLIVVLFKPYLINVSDIQT